MLEAASKPNNTLLMLTGGDGKENGKYLLSTEIYPSTPDCWLPHLPRKRSYHMTLVTSEPLALVATCGGKYKGNIKTTSCLVLDPFTQSWDESRMGDLTDTYNLAAAVTIDYIGVFVLGGLSTSQSSDFLAAGTLNWQRGPPLPMEMSRPCAVAITATSFLVIYDKAIHEFDAAIADPTRSEGWQEPRRWPSLKRSRTAGHGCTVIGQSVVIAGGHSGYGDEDRSQTTEVLDIQRRAIKSVGNMASKRGSFHLATLAFGGQDRVFAVGGYGGGLLDTVEEWVRETSSWKPADNLAEIRSNFGALALPRHLICPPGEPFEI